ncbi:MAG TPA: thiamine phosphate synthase [Acidimicrobiia bacterium]|nr:thiamine phosphate synthase [Acidimicrobiia bacterium]
MTVPHPLLVLTDASQARGRPLLDVVAAALRGGARAVVLREKHLPPPERAALGGRMADAVHEAGGTLIVASGLDDARVPVDGVHLGAADPRPTGPPAIVGRSCHDAGSLRGAAAEGCTYATLSPIFASASKPGYGPPLGPPALRDAPLPVFALGGVDPTSARACVDAGAHGIAVMGAVMRADDPAAVVRQLLAALRAEVTS